MEEVYPKTIEWYRSKDGENQDKLLFSTFDQICQAVFYADGEWERDE